MSVTLAQCVTIMQNLYQRDGDVNTAAALLKAAIEAGGAQGSQGDTGAQGAQGDAGAQGAQGAQGAAG